MTLGGAIPLLRDARADLSTAIDVDSLGVALTENFDSLASATSSTTPDGWGFTESSADPDQYTAGDGNSTAEDTYSYGVNADRALGGISGNGGAGSLKSSFGAKYTNNTGATINTLEVSYNGELWRLTSNGNGGNDGYDFQVSTTATDLSGTFTTVAALGYQAPDDGALGARTTPDVTAVSGEATGLSIPDGSTFMVKFLDKNGHSGDGEDGVAIDDFSLTADSDDDDADTIPDVSDNCPNTPNAGQEDTDIDGIGDACDDDADNDTVPDVDDNCPNDANADQADFDGDDEGDVCDADDDGDAVLDGDDDCDATPADEVGDVNAAGCGPSERDTDTDGVNDDVDNCVNDANADQANNDNDAEGDECDTDDDNDNVLDVDDACPLVSGTQPDGCPPPAPPPALTISDGSPAKATPNSECTITVTRSGDLSGTTTVDYTTVDGTAVAGKHFVADAGTLTFDADETTETIVIDVLKRAKKTKTFDVVLSNATNGTLGADVTGTCKIKRKR